MMGETTGNATRGRGEDAWRLEPEGETDALETKVVSDGVESVHVDLNGECHQERGQVKIPRGKVKRQEKKVKKLRARRENNSGGIRRNTGLRERSKGHGSGGR